MTTTIKQTVSIPNLYKGKFVDKEGMLTDGAKLFLSQLITQLQNILSPEGIALPKQSAANITVLNTTKSIGNVLFNTDTSEAMVNLTGTFKTITTS